MCVRIIGFVYIANNYDRIYFLVCVMFPSCFNDLVDVMQLPLWTNEQISPLQQSLGRQIIKIMFVMTPHDIPLFCLMTPHDIPLFCEATMSLMACSRLARRTERCSYHATSVELRRTRARSASHDDACSAGGCLNS